MNAVITGDFVSFICLIYSLFFFLNPNKNQTTTIVAWRFRNSEISGGISKPNTLVNIFSLSGSVVFHVVFPIPLRCPFSWSVISLARNCLLSKILKKAFGKSGSKV